MARRPTSRLSDTDKQRFQELAALQRIILEQDALIAGLERRPPAPRGDTAAAQDLAAARAELDSLQEELGNLRHAVTVKERQRFDMEAELRETILALDEKEEQLARVRDGETVPNSAELEELVRLSRLLQDQDRLLDTRQEELDSLRLQLGATGGHAAQGAPGPDPLRTEHRALQTRLLAERDRQAAMAGAQPWFPALSQPEDGYVFVVTYGMSGDVLLQDILNGIDGYCIRGENGNALGLLARGWTRFEQDQQQRQQTRQIPVTEALMAQDAMGWQLADTFVRTVLAPPSGVRTLGFREIRYPRDPAQFCAQLDFMYASFPNARFVFNTRTREDVARTGWWAQRDTATVVQELAQWDALFAAYLADHPGRGVMVHYDNLVADPETLRPLFDFLGQPFDPGAIARAIETYFERETASQVGGAA